MNTVIVLVDKLVSFNSGGTERQIFNFVKAITSANSQANVYIMVANQSEFIPVRYLSISGEEVSLTIEKNFNIKILNNIAHNHLVLKRALNVLKKTNDLTNVEIFSILHFEPNFWLKIAFSDFFRTGSLRLLFRQLIQQRLYMQSVEILIKYSTKYILLVDAFRKNIMFRNYNNIDVVRNFPTYDKKLINGETKQNLIITVCRLDLSQRRVDRLLLVWKELSKCIPNYTYLILGSGPDEAYLNRYIKKKGIINVRILGHVDPTIFYKKAKYLLHYAVTDAWGMVLEEAQCFNVWPIVWPTSKCYDVVIEDGKNGTILKNNLNKKYKQIYRLIRDRSFVKEELMIKKNISSIKNDILWKWRVILKF
jgi:glycosyltransferase involved in cell wall biosynthesis